MHKLLINDMNKHTTLTFAASHHKKGFARFLSVLSPYHNKEVFPLYRLPHITGTLYHCSIIGEKLGYGVIFAIIGFIGDFE